MSSMTLSRCFVARLTRAVCLNSTRALSPAAMSSAIEALATRSAACVSVLGVVSELASSSTSIVELLGLLGDLDPHLAAGVALDVGERRLRVVVRGELLELLLDPASAFHRELEVLAQLAVSPLPVRVQDLEQPGDRLADCLLVAGRQVRAEREVLVDGAARRSACGAGVAPRRGSPTRSRSGR